MRQNVTLGIDAVRAWTLTDGLPTHEAKKVRIAVIDDGNWSHPDIDNYEEEWTIPALHSHTGEYGDELRQIYL